MPVTDAINLALNEICMYIPQAGLKVQQGDIISCKHPDSDGIITTFYVLNNSKCYGLPSLPPTNGEGYILLDMDALEALTDKFILML